MNIIKYQIDIEDKSINENFKRLTNQIYKLLPNREENIDWQTPLSTIIEEFVGMQRLVDNTILFSLVCKLEGLYNLIEEKDFYLYRRTIFECLNLVQSLKESLLCQD